jgi:Uma2 family endonuclease
MTTLITSVYQESFPIHLDAILKNISDEEFFEMCRQNPDLRIEMLLLCPQPAEKLQNIIFH